MPYARDKADQGKSIALVAGIHLALGAVLIGGLGADPVREAADALTSIDVSLLPTPQPPPSPESEDSGAREEAAPENIRSKPLPLQAPVPRVPVPSPTAAAEVSAQETGTDRTAGAADRVGPGTGAGGDGSGFGGGGTGGSGAGPGGGIGSPAKLLRGMRSRLDESLLRGFATDRGSAVLNLTIGTDGRVERCTVAESTGSAPLDAELCSRMASRSRWAPAQDRTGRPIPVNVRYTAVWSRS